MQIDLHTHSTASDGSYTPRQLVRMAASEGINAIALTDHDTIAGLDEGESAAHEFGIEFIRGCEISTEDAGKRVHILGLFLPQECRDLDNLLLLRAAQRKNRNLLILEKLASLGIDISLEEVEAMATGSVGRPHIGMVLCKKHYVISVKDAFAIYLGDKGKAFVPKTSPTPRDAVECLSQVGAVAIMAHPYFGGHNDFELQHLLAELKDTGLSGLEAWHSRHSIKQTIALEAMAKKLGLAVSGGSDFHGDAKPNVKLGCTSDGLPVPPNLLKKLADIAAFKK